MKHLLVHIGLAKTGTTAVQRTLSRAARSGSFDGIAYPRLKGASHNFIAGLYRPYAGLPRDYKAAYASTEGRLELDRDVERYRQVLFGAIRSEERIIVSAETLSAFSTAEVAAFHQDLVRLGVTEVLVVAYVRDPADRYLSLVQQRLRASTSFPSPVVWKDDFMEVLERWGTVFEGAMSVRPYRRDLLVGGDVVGDLLSVASAFFGREVGGDLATQVSNESLSAEAMVVLHRYRTRHHPHRNVVTPDSRRLLSILSESKDLVAQTPARLDPVVEQLVVARHVHDVEALWRIHGADLRRPVGELTGGDPTGNGDTVHTTAEVSLDQVLAGYDEAIVADLMSHCLREALRPPATA